MRVPLLALGILAALGAAGVSRDGALVGTRPAPRPAARAPSAFQLLPGASRVSLGVNRVQCFVNNVGEQCEVGGAVFGASWPSGTPDGYIYNGGPQLAAIIPGDRAAFPWAGDTIGAFIFDAIGSQTAGTALSGVWNSLRPEDLAEWPSAAYVRDPALFDAALLGARTASEQDSWLRYWDAGLNGMYGRPHPMGLLVDQRTLAWNGPHANRDILYVIHRIINVSARAPSRYAGLAAAGYTTADIAEIARLGAQFQDSAEAKYQISIPDTGFTWTQLYVAMGQDPDVGDAGRNYATTVLPFATAIAYVSDFRQSNWVYPPDIFAPPFAAAPGFVGTRFLTAPSSSVTGGAAVTMFTNTTGGGALPDRRNVASLWRLLANRIGPSDGYCQVPPGRQVCYQAQTYADTRWYQSTGPYADVRAGESLVFAIAYVFAPPIASALTQTVPYPDYKPGIPGTGPRLAVGLDTVRHVERIAGWLSFQDANGDGDLQTREVRTVPYSLLHKAAVAQAFFDGKFVFPGAPPAPRFAVLPGDGQVTVVWQPSAAEVSGDPYFAVATDPLSPLYDANFRRYDVEGYRIWRGRSLASMEILAQFDHKGTTFTDYTGQAFGSGEQVGQCAPDLGIVTECRADFLHGQSRAVPLAGTFVQVPPGGRAALAGGGVLVLRADTAVTGGGSGLAALQDSGVPFAYVDTRLQNGTTYVYAVTAFDVNSVNAGLTSRESVLVGRTVTPRAASSNARAAAYVTGVYGGDDRPLETERAFPSIDPGAGTFSGPVPPANGGSIDLPVLVQELLPEGAYALRIDSVSPGFPYGWATPQPRVYFSALGGPDVLQGSAEVAAYYYYGSPNETTRYEYLGPLIPFDSAQVRRFGALLGSDGRILAQFTGLAPGLSASSPGVARAGYLGYAGAASRWLAHSRWYDDGATEPPDPTITPFASRAHTNGLLQAATAIFSPLPYRLPLGGGAPRQGIPSAYRNFVHATIAAWYPADFVVRWGSGGQVTVRDSTHRVDLPPMGAIQPGYGFLNAAALVAAGVTSTQLSDGSAGVTFDPAVVSYYSLRTLRPVCTVAALTAPCVALQPAARLQPVDVTNDGVADGTGIALLVNGEPFYMLMGALPAPGTIWHLRAVGGGAMTAVCAPELPSAGWDLLPGAEPSDCAQYAYTPPATRPAYAPGLRYTIRITRQFGADTTVPSDLSGIHTVPDPLYVVIGYAEPRIRFVNLPERAVIRIYTASGILVTVLTHNDPTAGGEEVWDATNRGGWRVASGLYFWHVEAPDGRTRIGRFTVVQVVPQ